MCVDGLALQKDMCVLMSLGHAFFQCCIVGACFFFFLAEVALAMDEGRFDFDILITGENKKGSEGQVLVAIEPLPRQWLPIKDIFSQRNFQTCKACI